MPKVSKLEEKALSFWAKKVEKGEIVAASTEIPGQYLRKILVAKKLAFPLRKGLYLLKKPEQDPKERLYLSYWVVVKKILARYQHWSIRGRSALDLYLGSQKIPEILCVRTSRKIKTNILLPFSLKIMIIHDQDFNLNTVGSFRVMGQEINLDLPELLLFEYQHPDQDFNHFIKAQTFDYRIIEVLYQEKARPIVAKRLIRLLNSAGRPDLAQKIQAIVDEYTGYRIGHERIEARTDPLPSLKPWAARLTSLIERYEKEVSLGLLPRINEIRRKPLRQLLRLAKENKKYDLYHSTTIEGYHITPEEISEVLFKYSGDKKSKEKKIEELKNKMAILGYSYAFDFVLSKGKEDFKHPQLSSNLIKDLYFQLFRPSADLKILDRFSLAAYRRQQNYIRGSRHIPPAPEKLTDLMEEFEAKINSLKNPVIKAILTHCIFVYLHPYLDGNGRCARLLMNYVLLASGYPWITIRAEDREKYFAALEEAHLNENVLPFAKFIFSFLEKRN